MFGCYFVFLLSALSFSIKVVLQSCIIVTMLLCRFNSPRPPKQTPNNAQQNRLIVSSLFLCSTYGSFSCTNSSVNNSFWKTVDECDMHWSRERLVQLYYFSCLACPEAILDSLAAVSHWQVIAFLWSTFFSSASFLQMFSMHEFQVSQVNCILFILLNFAASPTAILKTAFSLWYRHLPLY